MHCYLDYLDPNTKSLMIPDRSFGIDETFILSKLNMIKSIKIGNDCFKNVYIFKIDGLNELKSLKIRSNSFDRYLLFDYSGYGMFSSPENEFYIVNCPELESIDIGEYSFVNFEYFRLSKLPKLKSIRIASFGCNVPSSRGSSFVIKGIID